jgi:hypothetical protein
MRRTAFCALVLLLSSSAARAQSPGDLQIRVGPYAQFPDGGEKPTGVWYVVNPVTVERTLRTTVSWASDSCEGWAVSSATDIRKDATTAWKIELTPLRIVKDAVTFRIRWTRANLRQGADPTWPDVGKAHEEELTLRPGESVPMDEVQVPDGARTIDGRKCGSAASIRVLVDNYPSEEQERRLVAADLWLVERLANGSETPRSKPLSIRGLANYPFPFYFDSVVEAQRSLTIAGKVRARLDTGAIALVIDTRSLWDDSGAWRSAKSELGVAPGETVEVRLPKLDANAGPFAGRDFSIKVRARQLR